MGVFIDKAIDILEKVQRVRADVQKLDSFGFSVSAQLQETDSNGKTIRRDKLPIFPEWFWSARLGQPRRINFTEVRQFARSPWVQMALSTIKKEVMTIDWDVVNVDKDDQEKHEEDKEKLLEFFKRVNSDNLNIIDVLNPIITELGEIDSGVLAKIFSVGSYERVPVPTINDLGIDQGEETVWVLKPFGERELVELRNGDAATFLKQIDVYGRLQGYFQYSFKNPRQNPQKFQRDEIAYFQMNTRSYTLYGFSPVQAVQQVLEVLIQSTRWNKEFFKSNAIPDGIVGLPGADPEGMKQFREQWAEGIQGRAHKLLFHNTDASFSTFSPNSKDMEWLQGQKWYFHLVFGVFGVSPVEAGFHEETNRSSQEGQERVTVKNAIKPYLATLAEQINKDIVTEILQQENPKVMFKFFPLDHVQEKINFENSMKEIETGTLTINEVRTERGREIVEWGDTPGKVPSTSVGFTDPALLDNPEGQVPKDSETPSTKYYKKSFEKFMREHGDNKS